jgi:glycerol-3-phosphate O-acyltransferase 3/4
MATSSVAGDIELDRANLEDYLPSDSLPQEFPRNLHL